MTLGEGFQPSQQACRLDIRVQEPGYTKARRIVGKGQAARR